MEQGVFGMFYLFEVLPADLGADVQQVFGTEGLELKRGKTWMFFLQQIVKLTKGEQIQNKKWVLEPWKTSVD